MRVAARQTLTLDRFHYGYFEDVPPKKQRIQGRSHFTISDVGIRHLYNRGFYTRCRNWATKFITRIFSRRLSREELQTKKRSARH